MNYRFLGLTVWAVALLPAHGQDRAETIRQARQAGIDAASLQFHEPKGTFVEPSLGREAVAQAVVALVPGTSPILFAASFGMEPVRAFRSEPSVVVLRGTTPAAVARLLPRLQQHPLVRAAYQDYVGGRTRSQFVPNDPFFSPNQPSAGYAGAWHLKNGIGGTVDVRIEAPWIANWLGRPYVIGIVDDGLQTAHPDLSPNYRAADSWDFGQNDADPNPVFGDDVHGTSVAGVAAARGGNGRGSTGAAPFAYLAGLRVDFNTGTDQSFADATLFRSSGATRTIAFKNHSYGYGLPFVSSLLERDALATSAASGTVHTLAAGNDRGTTGQDATKKMMNNVPATFTIAALGADGKFADYSNFGANVICTAPSSSAGQPGILTTDRTGADGYNGTDFPNLDYTSAFGGTSSAAPLAAGVLAVAKSAWNRMDPRFLKHLVVLTSTVVDPTDATEASDGGWRANAAGNRFNPNYGFGLLNAELLVAKSRQYNSVSPLETDDTGLITVNKTIPDNATAGLVQTFSITKSRAIEEISVTVNATHPYRGDLEAYLISPRGTVRRLFTKSADDADPDLNWTFTSNAFWGEHPQGTWRLKVVDTAALDVGTLNSIRVTSRHGVLVPASVYNAAKFWPATVPTTMKKGLTYNVSLLCQNTGNTDWSKATGYSLGSVNPTANTTWGMSKVDLGATETIRPGMYKTFAWTVTAPSTPGTYSFQWMMRKDATYFTNASAPVTVTVTN